VGESDAAVADPDALDEIAGIRPLGRAEERGVAVEIWTHVASGTAENLTIGPGDSDRPVHPCGFSLTDGSRGVEHATRVYLTGSPSVSPRVGG
jgi:hypothetical protein